MAEEGGFEPPVEFYPYDGLANRCLQPLGHSSTSGLGMFRQSVPIVNHFKKNSQNPTRQTRRTKKKESGLKKLKSLISLLLKLAVTSPARPHGSLV